MSKRKTYQGRDNNNYQGYKKRRTNGNGGFKKIPYRRFTPRTMGPFAQSESKYADSGIDPTAIAEATTWSGTELDPLVPVNTLFSPNQGTGINERIGRRVSLYKLAIRGLISTTVLQDQADIVSSPAVRIIVYIDKQTNGVQSQGEDVISIGAPITGNITASVETAFNSFQNINNFGRFQVLKDVTYRPRMVTAGTDGTNTNSMNVSQIPFKLVCKFKTPLVIKFDGTTASGSVADIVDNSIHLIANKSGTAFASTLQYICRGYFKDV